MVRKRLMPVFLAAAMAALLAACKASSGVSETTETERVETEPETGSSQEENAGGQERVKIGMVVNPEGEEDFFCRSLQAGLERAAQELGIQAEYLEAETETEYGSGLKAFMEADYDLIIGAGAGTAEGLREAAEARPDIWFAAINDVSNADLDNVACLAFRQSQPFYLAGMVAGMMTQSGKAGFISGLADEAADQLGYSYCAGVLDANPEVQILQKEVWSSEEAAEGALQMMDDGADVIFCVALDGASGVAESCRERGVWVIGTDPLQPDLGQERVLAVVTRNLEEGVFALSEDCVSQELQGGIVVYDLNNEGVDLLLSEDNLPEEVQRTVEEIKEKIKSGEITLPGSREEFEAAYGDVYQLDD